jgi:hypothetical protein
LNMAGVVLHSLVILPDGGLNMPFGSSLQAFVVDLRGDISVTAQGGAGNTPILSLPSGGTLLKSEGTGQSTLDSPLMLRTEGATIQVNSGHLALPGDGSLFSGTTRFVVSPDALVDLVPTNQTARFNGTFTGVGGGQVQFRAGRLDAWEGGASLDFPEGMFHWLDGEIWGNAFGRGVTNRGTLALSGPGTKTASGVFNNCGTVLVQGAGGLNLPFGSAWENLPGALVDLQSDAGLIQSGGGGATPAFNNGGEFRKSGGTGISSTVCPFNNLGGLVRVDVGTLVLAGGGTSSNGTWIVSAGAVLDLTGGSTPKLAGVFQGSGSGRVLVSSGRLTGVSSGAVLNLPGELFEWVGGEIGSLTNAGTMTLPGQASVGVAVSLYNAGVMRFKPGATLNVPFGAVLENQSGGQIDLQGDVSLSGVGGGGGMPLVRNLGWIRKSAGTASAVIEPLFENQGGSLEVTSGTLNVNAFSQGGGSLKIVLGGPGAGQCGRLLVAGTAELGGQLQVSLANGFAPAPGQQIQILSCGTLRGTFAAMDIPNGLSVTYNPTGVTLTVVQPLPFSLTKPTLVSGGLAFSFGTLQGRNYSVLSADSVDAANWSLVTNVLGTGVSVEIVVPLGEGPRRFYRVATAGGNF